MIEAILREMSESDFDFRMFANPGDPLAGRFEEWVPYYRLKFCIARILRPETVLEIGVRYGYSSRTFLEACPNAKLLGIDLDCDDFGGQRGALEWARRITAGYDAEYLVADSQKMERFPGGTYDLIHVDGQQDGLGTFHDLRRAVAQARWVLLDGYFWTKENFLNADDFLLKFRDAISYAVVIPGYAGELLIKVSTGYLDTIGATPSSGAHASSEIVDFYDTQYYLSDCGGHESFRKSGGKQITDGRLLAMLALSQLAPKGVAMDLGCGRGELTYQLALNGRHVLAIDYSPTAVELARNCFRDEREEVKRRVEFICRDVTELSFSSRFKLALAGDLVEHLSPAELERFVARVADHLDDDGLFVIHTFPNLWYYKKHYPRLRAAAKQLGGFLPAEPRSRHELLMHINEQSPAILRRTLSKRFRYVSVWVGTPNFPEGDAPPRSTIGELIKGTDVYALASQSPIDFKRGRALLTQLELANETKTKIRLSVGQSPEKVSAGQIFDLRVLLVNHSTTLVSSMPPYPINISYHWFFAGTKTALIFDGLRTSIPFPLDPGETREVIAIIEAPHAVGDYDLVMTLVQEECCWLDSAGAPTVAVAQVRVV